MFAFAAPLVHAAGLNAPPAQDCAKFFGEKPVVFADQHDGDEKLVTYTATTMEIHPHGNNQTWVVKANLRSVDCSAMVDFNVPGKPGPPPVSLRAELSNLKAADGGGSLKAITFTDPTGTIGPRANYPLNTWISTSP